MGRWHKVERGECISSIAFQYGFYPDTLWKLPENAPLREKRADPNVLLEGDEVFIPDRRLAEVEAAVGKRHRFRRKAVPEMYRARFLDREGKPRAGLSYMFFVGDLRRKGELDADGWLKQWIPPDCKSVRIELYDGSETEEYEVLLGHLEPLTELRGVQARLNNLGYACGEETGELTPATRAAIEQFQREQGLTVTGQPDDATRAKLQKAYGA